MPTLRIPTPLRSYTDDLVEVMVAGDTVAQAMEHLVEKYPPLKPHLYNGDGQLRPFVNLFLDGHNVKDLKGMDTPLPEDARLLLVPSIAGGS